MPTPNRTIKKQIDISKIETPNIRENKDEGQWETEEDVAKKEWVWKPIQEDKIWWYIISSNKSWKTTWNQCQIYILTFLVFFIYSCYYFIFIFDAWDNEWSNIIDSLLCFELLSLMNLTKIDLLGFVVAVIFCLLALLSMGFLCFCQFHSRSLYPLLHFVSLSPLTYQANYFKSYSFIFDNDDNFQADIVNFKVHF